MKMSVGPFVAGVAGGGAAVFAGAHGWRICLVGAVVGVTWAVAQIAKERELR